MIRSLFLLLIITFSETSSAQSIKSGHWLASLVMTKSQPNTMSFVNPSYGLALIDSGQNTFTYHTSDAGKSWTRWEPDSGFHLPTGGVRHPLQALSFRDLDYCDGFGYWISRDSGRSYSRSMFPTDPTSEIAVHMFSPQFGRYIVSNPLPRFQVMETRDSGISFQLRSALASTSACVDGVFIDSSFYLVALNPKCIIRTRDGGLTWDTVFNSVNFVYYKEMTMSPDRSHIYVTGGEFNGKVFSASFFESRDTGNTWRADSSIFGNRISKLVYQTSGNIWALVNHGRNNGNTTPADSIFFSSNDGESWLSDGRTFAGQSLYDIEWPDSAHGYLFVKSGDSTIIYRYVSDPASVESRDDPQRSLFVSYYPSPATRSLTIKLLGTASLPGAAISAGMYDLLGRKVLDLSALANSGNNGFYSLFQADVSTLPPSLYTLFYTFGGYSYGRSVVIVH